MIDLQDSIDNLETLKQDAIIANDHITYGILTERLGIPSEDNLPEFELYQRYLAEKMLDKKRDAIICGDLVELKRNHNYMEIHVQRILGISIDEVYSYRKRLYPEQEGFLMFSCDEVKRLAEDLGKKVKSV